jgi:hypothetical protein
MAMHKLRTHIGIVTVMVTLAAAQSFSGVAPAGAQDTFTLGIGKGFT